MVRHTDSKGIYIVLFIGLVKIGKGNWVDSVSYEAMGKINPIVYTRVKDDFMQEFEVVE